MALETSKQINLNGYSVIDGQNVVALNASIPSETGVGNVNQYIQNVELYDANRTLVRRDIAEFQTLVYEIEDEITAESAEVPA